MVPLFRLRCLTTIKKFSVWEIALEGLRQRRASRRSNVRVTTGGGIAVITHGSTCVPVAGTAPYAVPGIAVNVNRP